MSTPLSLEELQLDLIAAKLCGQDRAASEDYWIVEQTQNGRYLEPVHNNHDTYFIESDAKYVLSDLSERSKWFYFRTAKAAEEFYAKQLKLNS